MKVKTTISSTVFNNVIKEIPTTYIDIEGSGSEDVSEEIWVVKDDFELVIRYTANIRETYSYEDATRYTPPSKDVEAREIEVFVKEIYINEELIELSEKQSDKLHKEILNNIE